MILSWKKTCLKTAAFVLGGALLLPSVTAHAATAYTATDNDTFWSLSKKFGVPLTTLMSANSKIDPLNIYAGLKLTIPSTVSAKSNASVSAQSVTTAAGKSLSYSKVIDVKATAYSAAAEENGKWGGVDYFGDALELGTIAVDPKVIPLGTKLYVTGYDFNGLPVGGLVGTAKDAGSAIKGNRIDIFIPGSRSFVSGFGIQNVKVYVLK
ncbi:3D domain-containing protein [Cohnella faecalis]|uniref:LysM peptidoglycan-binding domain-containing protein n=1 Tax=Cohnella faecalis TaxID=2315694 RepID=A0A398CUV7_9BACL|nr:3D domain-containing protein [Cohnella faecalis]RIE02794.1 LysM peptidoglycan-binding domain-containing protein [Cohnella faecalis]